VSGENLNNRLESRPLRILITGSLQRDDNEVPGGCAVSLVYLVEHLVRDETVDVRVADTMRIRGHGVAGAFRFVQWVFQILCDAPQVDVITLHCSRYVIAFLGFFHLLVARLLRKPLIIRLFAGHDCMSMGPVRGRLARFVAGHADLFLVETMHLVCLAQARGVQKVRWFPTCRAMHLENVRDCERTTCRRFVYVGQVREYKGIRELVQAAERLDNGASVDVYGPLFDDLPHDLFHGCRVISYTGVLKHENVVPTMRQYDALVMPTKALTEGYPGVILEAYMADLPVITTTCGAIPEIVDETSGILVEPKNAEALYRAMKRLSGDPELYVRLCKGAQDRAGQFSAEYWTNKFVGFCWEVFERKQALG
jgi:glycosyltransferase involved in cell wall biosynthesis